MNRSCAGVLANKALPDYPQRGYVRASDLLFLLRPVGAS